MRGDCSVKLNITPRPIANKYCEGKMKRTLKRELKVSETAEKVANEASYWCVWLFSPYGLNVSLLQCHRDLGFLKTIAGAAVFSSEFTMPGYYSWPDSGNAFRTSIFNLSQTCSNNPRLLVAKWWWWSMFCFMTMTKWLYSPRLETRTKESNSNASMRVVNLYAKWKWWIGFFCFAQSTAFDLLWRVWVRAFRLGPERWWTISG